MTTTNTSTAAKTLLGYSPWGGPHNGGGPFTKLFTNTVDASKHGLKGLSAFILWGGTDIHPSLYKAKTSTYGQPPYQPSARDIWEWKALQYCKYNNIPVIGVCRGAQIMNAFAGGKLIQHVNNHHGDHVVVDKEGNEWDVTSCHHQMLDLEGVDAELLAWTPQVRSRVFMGEDDTCPAHVQKALSEGTFREPETVFFPEFKGIGFQGHPEWAGEKRVFVKTCLDQVTQYCLENPHA